MFLILWEYQVKPEQRSAFEKIYSSNGAWAELFKTGSGYLGTQLLHDTTNAQHYLTLDRWNSKEGYEDFLLQRAAEYKVLDAHCEGLTEKEFLLGKWHTTE